MEKKKVVLKSSHPSDYPDLVIECRVIPNDKIGEYLSTIPDDKKFYAHKSESVSARRGVPGEKIKTTLKTYVDGKEYILSEEENTVQERPYKDTTMPDVVVTNDRSTSNEKYIVKFQKFVDTYDIIVDENFHERYVPKKDSRLVTKINENVIIMTSWGEPAVCLAGGFIVTYDEASNDYNTIEQGAFDSTYEIEEQKKR